MRGRVTVLARIERLIAAILVTSSPSGAGVSELRINYGPWIQGLLPERGEPPWIILLAGETELTSQGLDEALLLADNLGGGDLMKNYAQPDDVARSSPNTRGHGSLFGSLHSRRPDGDVFFIAKALGEHCTCPGVTQGGQRFGAFQGEPSLQGPCLESGSPEPLTLS